MLLNRNDYDIVSEGFYKFGPVPNKGVDEDVI